MYTLLFNTTKLTLLQTSGFRFFEALIYQHFVHFWNCKRESNMKTITFVIFMAYQFFMILIYLYSYRFMYSMVIQID